MQSVSLKKSLTFPRSAAEPAVSILPKRIPDWRWACFHGLLPAMRRTHKPRRRRPKSKRNMISASAGFTRSPTLPTATLFARIRPNRGELWSVSASRIAPGWAMKRTSATPVLRGLQQGRGQGRDNVTDFSFSYLLQSPTVYGVQPFLTLGGGIIVFSPTGTVTNLNSTDADQPTLSVAAGVHVYSVGLNYPIFSRVSGCVGSFAA